MAKKNIYDNDPLYSFLKPIVDWHTKTSYRKVEIRGKENLPTDGPMIIAPNHCNTLMDAIVMLRAYKDPTVFGARADMFNNKMVARLMYFFRILPMVRQRDGLRNVLKNVETQEVIVDTLENNVRFCMFPEGRHRAEKSLLPLGKGVFRAALAANTRFGESRPVYIVPVGLEYGDFFRYRSTSLVTFGKPINVTEFVKSHPVENEAQIIEPLRKELTGRMSELFTYIPDGENLKEKWTLTKMLSISSSANPYGNFGTCLYDSMMDNRKIVASIEDACKDNPEKMDELFKNVAEFEKFRNKDGISIYSFRKGNGIPTIIGKTFASIIGLPYFLFSLAVNLPTFITEKIVRSKIKDRAFRNTVSFGVRLGFDLTWIPAAIITAFCLFPWYIALAGTLLTIPSYGYIHDYIEGMRRFVSDIRVIRYRKLRKRFSTIIENFNRL